MTEETKLQKFMESEAWPGDYIDIDEFMDEAREQGYDAEYKNVVSKGSGWLAVGLVVDHENKDAYQFTVDALGNSDPMVTDLDRDSYEYYFVKNGCKTAKEAREFIK